TKENASYISQLDTIERTLLPKCDLLTCAAPLIGKAYRSRYGIEMATILNVFPLSEMPTESLQSREEKEPSIYWFSQTIGPERGLEEFLAGIGSAKSPISLQLRGFVEP